MVIEIDSSGLSEIYAANQTVTLTRQIDAVVETFAEVRSPAAASAPVVAWQVFQPLGSNNIAWSDDYYCFATTTVLSMGAVIEMNAQYPNPLLPGSVYTFANGQFTQQIQAGTAYIIANASPSGSYVFGLAQSATINSVATLAPLCAMPVLNDEAAYITPSDLISIFLSSSTSDGTVLPPPTSAFAIATNGSGSGPTIGFNDQTNMFFQIS